MNKPNPYQRYLEAMRNKEVSVAPAAPEVPRIFNASITPEILEIPEPVIEEKEPVTETFENTVEAVEDAPEDSESNPRKRTRH